MRREHEGLQLRIFVHESLRHEHVPLYAAIVSLAHREGLAGAVVFRCIEGFGQHRHLHTSRLVEVSDDLPIIVEVVDRADAIRNFVLTLEALIPHGTATLSPVRLIHYRRGQGA